MLFVKPCTFSPATQYDPEAELKRLRKEKEGKIKKFEEARKKKKQTESEWTFNHTVSFSSCRKHEQVALSREDSPGDFFFTRETSFPRKEVSSY